MSTLFSKTAKPSEVMGAILTRLRQQAGMDQENIAHHLGITQASWSRIESGKATINIEQLLVACSVIGVDFVHIARIYEEICDLLKRNKIHTISGLKTSTASNDLALRTLIKDLILEHARAISNHG